MTKDFVVGVSCGVVLAGVVFVSFIAGCVVSAEVSMDRLEKNHGRLEVLK